MEARRFEDTYVLRLDRGEEVIASLVRLCEQEDIRLASVQAIGAADHAVIGVYDLSAKVFRKKELNEVMEITSLMGNVTRREGRVYPHLHATLCGTTCAAQGGHVNELRIGVTCELFVRCLPGEVHRVPDPETGINILAFSGDPVV